MMNSKQRLVLVTLALVAAVTPAFAQGPAPPPAPSEVPLDGLSTLLIAAGAAYGGKKLMRKKKASDQRP